MMQLLQGHQSHCGANEQLCSDLRKPLTHLLVPLESPGALGIQWSPKEITWQRKETCQSLWPMLQPLSPPDRATYSFTGEESRVGDSISSKLSSKERASISPSIEDPKEFIHVRKKEGGEGIEAKHCILFLFLWQVRVFYSVVLDCGSDSKSQVCTNWLEMFSKGSQMGISLPNSKFDSVVGFFKLMVIFTNYFTLILKLAFWIHIPK